MGSARALCLDDRLGNFSSGKEADFAILDASALAITKRRLESTNGIAGKLFAISVLGDCRIVAATHLMGRSTK
jgi:guanine deaminase